MDAFVHVVTLVPGTTLNQGPVVNQETTISPATGDLEFPSTTATKGGAAVTQLVCLLSYLLPDG